MQSTPCSTSTSPLGHYRPDRKIFLDTKTVTSSTTDAVVKSSRVTCLPLLLEEPSAWALTTTLALDLSMDMDTMTDRLVTTAETEALLVLHIRHVTTIGEDRRLQTGVVRVSDRTETVRAMPEGPRLSMAAFRPAQRQTCHPDPVLRQTAGLRQPTGALPTTPTHMFRTTIADHRATGTIVGGEMTPETLMGGRHTAIRTDLLRASVNAIETAMATATENGTVTKDEHAVEVPIGEEGTAKTMRGERDCRIASVSFIGDEANTALVVVSRIRASTWLTIAEIANLAGGSEDLQSVAMNELCHHHWLQLFQISAALQVSRTCPLLHTRYRDCRATVHAPHDSIQLRPLYSHRKKRLGHGLLPSPRQHKQTCGSRSKAQVALQSPALGR